MAKVIITKALRDEIFKKFKSISDSIFLHMKSLEKFPSKGKALANVGRVVIKELKYEKFRFYFITDGYILKFGTREDLENIVIKFVRMSEKKNQKKIMGEIENLLDSVGFEKFK